MNTITVMITACGSQFAPGIINCFKKNKERNIRVVGGDMNNDPSNKYLVDSFYVIPPVSSENYAEVILDICIKEKVEILFPQMSAELPIYLRNLHMFDCANVKVSVTQNQNLLIANNKLCLLEFMKNNSIPHCNFVRVNSLEEYKNGLKYLDFPDKPVCIKMTESSGSRGVRIIKADYSKFDLFAHEKPSSLLISEDNMFQTLREVKQFPELVMMEYMPGDEYTIGVLADKGKVKFIAGRRNPVMMMSISQESVVEKNNRAYDIATQVVEKLELDGVIGMDFMFDYYGQIQLMEINPRIDATVSLFAAAGLNLPYLCVKQILGEELPNVDIKYGTRLKRRYMEFFTDRDGRLIDVY